MTGLISAATGGVLAAVQRGLRPLMGYAALFDLGCLLVALAIGGEGGALAFSTGLAIRGLGMGMIGAATASIGQSAGGNGLTVLRGAAHRAPLDTAALLVGGLTLAGLPLTAGFVPRWFLMQDLARIDSRWVWLIVAAGLGVVVGYLRILHAMLEPPLNPSRSELPLQIRPATLILLALALISLALGAFPEPLLDAAQRLLTAYSLPSL
jgi:formate hydrogenlyase subunit 3/multisubunit Na+/H+ antiporter MnhD subunit